MPLPRMLWKSLKSVPLGLNTDTQKSGWVDGSDRDTREPDSTP